MIRKIQLRQFRNYDGLDLDVTAPLNVLTGRNGQGKSNLLEAIFFVSMLRSFRTSQTRELKQIGSGGFMAAVEIDPGRGWSTRLEVEYSDVRKLKIDGQNVSRASEFIRQLHTVAFSPEDIQTVTGNSSFRRRFIDMFVSMLEPAYMLALQHYLGALKSRNAALRLSRPDPGVVAAYEPILAEAAALIIGRRREYLALLRDEVARLLSDFHGMDRKVFDIRYRPSVEGGAADVARVLAASRKRDLERRFTGCGPQLDEMDLIFDGRLLRSFGSTGQCRLISLCLKMAELNLLAAAVSHRKEQVVVLVDDVTGELDEVTRRCFFQVINCAAQSFFTFTEKPSDVFFADARYYQVEDGKITDI